MARLLGNFLVIVVLLVVAAGAWSGSAFWQTWLPTLPCLVAPLANLIHTLALLGFAVGLGIWVLSSFRFYPGGAMVITSLLASTGARLMTDYGPGSCGTPWSM